MQRLSARAAWRKSTLPSDAKARCWYARAHYNRHLRHKPEWPGAKQKTHKETPMKSYQDNKEEKQRPTEKQSKRESNVMTDENSSQRAEPQRREENYQWPVVDNVIV